MTTILNLSTSSPRRRAPRPIRWLLVSAVAIALSGQAHADAVTDWNATAGGVAARFGAPQQQARAMAIVQIAVHDALNSIDRRYDAYAIVPAASPAASPQAAVAAAARGALLGLLPAVPGNALAIAAVNDAYSAALAAIADGPAKTQGIAAGTNAATAILAMRVGDGSATPHLPYTLAPGPGVYQPTPNPEFPAAIVPMFAGWALVTPFAINSASQFEVEPGEIFDLSSEAFAREYNEVKNVGNALVRGAAPNSDESDVARFWPGGGSNWNLTARLIVDGLGMDAWQHARLFALMNIAEADAHIANQHYKYAYNFWRPVTAIRGAVDDGNPRTINDPGWRPFLVTPPYPDYPSALCSLVGAQTEVLRRVLGTDEVSFTRTFNAGLLPLPAPLDPLPAKTIVRHFESLSQAASEAVDARVFGGLHYRSADEAGIRLGRHVGHYVVNHYLRPVRPVRPARPARPAKR